MIAIVYLDDPRRPNWRIPVTGGPRRFLAANQASTWDIAIDDKNIYWTNAVTNGAVLKLAK